VLSEAVSLHPFRLGIAALGMVLLMAGLIWDGE